MENQTIRIEHLVNLLIQKSGLTVGELANQIGVTRQTLSNWRKGNIQTLDSQTIKKLSDTLENSNWGIKLGNISGSHIEIINTIGDENKIKPKDDLNDLVIKLTRENLILREKLEKYESNKN